MADIPDVLTNKFNEALRNFLGAVGVIAGIVAWVKFGGDNKGHGLIASMVCIGAFIGAAKLKVHYRLRRGKIEYE